MRYKNRKMIIMAISIFLIIVCLNNMKIFTKIKNYMGNLIFNFCDNVIHEHFYAFVNDEENLSFNEIVINRINSEMYGMDYLLKEGRKQSLVQDAPVYLSNSLNIVSYEENNTDKGENLNNETTETIAILKPENSITYTMEQLSDFNFLLRQLYTVPSRAQVLESDLVAEKMLAKDMTIKGNNEMPQILIYHTHSQEKFADSSKEGMSIVEVGDYLTELLTYKYNFNVIHCRDSFDLTNGVLDRSNAYKNALPAVKKILEENPSIEVVIDLHRDGLPEGADKLVTTINGKETAKIMFFNGVSRSSATGEIDYLYNPYREENLALSFQMKLKAMEYFPGFTRKNYIDAYQYNMHVIDKAMLIEVGAQNNNFSEAKNAMEPLAAILYMVFSKEG